MATSTITRADVPDTSDLPVDAAGLLAAARGERRAADRAEARLLGLAVEWVLAHPADEVDTFPATIYVGGHDTELTVGGEGCPSIAEFAVPEFAAAVGLGTEAGKTFLGQALELAYRLPRLWRRVQGGDLPAWKARRVARETIGNALSREAARFVDTQAAPVAHKLTPAQLDRTVNEATGRFMPEKVARLAEESWDKRHATVHDQEVSFTGTMRVSAELDIADAVDLETALTTGAARLAALGSPDPLDVRRAQTIGDLARAQLTLDLNQPSHADDLAPEPGATGRVKPRQAVIYVHLFQAAVTGQGAGLAAGEAAGLDPALDPKARVERGNSLVLVDQVRSWCAHPDTQVIIRPVPDLDTCRETSTAQVPAVTAEHVDLRDRTCVFPWCTSPARRCDTDHVIPAGTDGGITCPCNLAPLCRRHHRLKTHSPWTYLVVDPGTFLWTSPHGYQFLRDHTGTLDVTEDRPRPRPPDRPPDA